MTEISIIIKKEVTALRGKIKEITENSVKKDLEIRDKVKGEFIDLITDLVNVNTMLKTYFDVYKLVRI